MRTFVCFVLDKSGSMASCREATISGFNKWLLGIKNEPDTFLTLTMFDTGYCHREEETWSA